MTHTNLINYALAAVGVRAAQAKRIKALEQQNQDLLDLGSTLAEQAELAQAHACNLQELLDSTDAAATFLWRTASQAQRSLIKGDWETARDHLSAVSVRTGLYPKIPPTLKPHYKPWDLDQGGRRHAV